MKNRETSEDWHSLAATALSHSFCLGYDPCMEEVKALLLIPLITGEWVSIKRQAVYFSSINGVKIPSNLEIALVSPRAASNPQRKQLFKDLGAQQAPVDFVRNLIKEKSSGAFAPPVPRDRLLFLYLTERLGSTSSQALLMDSINDKGPAIFDHKDQMRWPKVDTVYLPNDDPYGAKALLGPIQGEAPGLDVLFINEEIYLRDPPSCPLHEQQTWIEWL